MTFYFSSSWFSCFAQWVAPECFPTSGLGNWGTLRPSSGHGSRTLSACLPGLVLMLCWVSRTQLQPDNRGGARSLIGILLSQSAPRGRPISQCSLAPVRSLGGPRGALVNPRPSHRRVGSGCLGWRAPLPMKTEPVSGHVGGRRRVPVSQPMGRGGPSRRPPNRGAQGAGREMLMGPAEGRGGAVSVSQWARGRGLGGQWQPGRSWRGAS